MQFEVSVDKILAPVWNKDEVKAAVAAKLVEYENAVYTPETIQTAKADRADLNKIAKAIEDERKRVKSIYNAPYLEFEKQVKEVTGMIEKTVSAIDVQVKAFEAKAREEKLEAIKKAYATYDMNGVPFDVIKSDKWLLSSTSMSSIEKDLARIADEIAADMSVLQGLTEYQFEAIEKYRQTGGLSDAMRVVNELKAQAERKAQYEAVKNTTIPVAPKEHPVQEVVYDDGGLPDFDAIGDGRHTIIIKAKVTNGDEAELKFLLQGLGIEFEIIGG